MVNKNTIKKLFMKLTFVDWNFAANDRFWGLVFLGLLFDDFFFLGYVPLVDIAVEVLKTRVDQYEHECEKD